MGNLLSGAIHAVGDIAAPAIKGVGAVTSLGNAAPNPFSRSATQLGNNIANPNVTLTNTGGVLQSNNQAFTGPFAYGTYNGLPSSSGADSSAFTRAAADLGGTLNDPSGSGPYTGGSGGSGGGAPVNNAGSQADIAAYQDQISSLNGLLGQADISRQNGTNSINRSFDNNGLRLQDQLNGNNQRYDQQQNDTTKAYGSNLDTIQSQARNGYQSLQSLLGGTGSAGDILAPWAVSQDAGAKTKSASDAYAGNLSSLDLARKDAKQQYENAYSDLTSQKNSKLSNLISSIDQQKISYQQQLGQAQNQLNIAQGGSYATPTANNGAIAALQAEQQGLDAQYQDPTYQMQNIAGQNPNLAGYQAKAAQVGGLSNQPTSDTNDPAAAFLALLRQQQQQSQNQYQY